MWRGMSAIPNSEIAPNCLFRKHKLQLHSDAPVANLVGFFNILEILELCIHRLLTDTEKFTNACTQGKEF
jgi:hypothetical protein